MHRTSKELFASSSPTPPPPSPCLGETLSEARSRVSLRLPSVLTREQVAGPGDIAVDCTAGNGHDSLALGRMVGLKDGLGKLYCIDIQVRAPLSLEPPPLPPPPPTLGPPLVEEGAGRKAEGVFFFHSSGGAGGTVVDSVVFRPCRRR